MFIGFWVHTGSETKEDWMSNINNLITRGLKYPLLVASDDLSGSKNAIATQFPRSDHQLCFTHFKRNIDKHLKKQDAQTLKNTLDKAKLYHFEEAKAMLEDHLSSIEGDHNFTKHHKNKINNYLYYFEL